MCRKLYPARTAASHFDAIKKQYGNRKIFSAEQRGDAFLIVPNEGRLTIDEVRSKYNGDLNMVQMYSFTSTVLGDWFILDRPLTY